MDVSTAPFMPAASQAPSDHELAIVTDAPSIVQTAGAAPPVSVDDTAGDPVPPLAAEASDNVGDNRLRPISLAGLFALDIKPRGMVLDPIIPEKGLALLYGARGAGKTHVAHGIAYAVATGTGFLKWRADRPRRVLLIDGEMPAQALRERLEQVAAAHSPEFRRTGVESVPFDITAGDLIDRGIGDLASPSVQAKLEPWLQGVELLILDNLSSLTTELRENDADAWSPIQQWLLRLRRRGISVLIVHHAGKGGGQRGTSRREDVLDTSICLRRPGDYVPTEGARFELHIEKGRGIHGDQAEPFEARLSIVDGRTVWSMKKIEDVERARIATLLDLGFSIRDIAEETGLHRSKVHRLKQRIEEKEAETDTAVIAPGTQAESSIPPSM
jgi:putative DNA primase/helicase